MKQKYWLCKRKNTFFSFDSETGKRESLFTDDKEEAQRILRARNDAGLQPAINISIAKAYLLGTDPKLVERTPRDASAEGANVKTFRPVDSIAATASCIIVVLPVPAPPRMAVTRSLLCNLIPRSRSRILMRGLRVKNLLPKANRPRAKRKPSST